MTEQKPPGIPQAQGNSTGVPSAQSISVPPLQPTSTLSPRIVIFNGPPGSGKSTVVEAIVNGYAQAVHCQFAAPLKAAAACLLGISIEEIEAKKDDPLPLVDKRSLNKTLRGFLIALSEDFVKPHLGQAAFGKVAAKGITNWHNRSPSHWLYLFSDGGFEQEFLPLINEFGAENMLVIHLHRQGCNYKKDSRAYVNVEVLATPVVLKNDGTVEDLISNAGKIIEDWILTTIGKKTEDAKGIQKN